MRKTVKIKHCVMYIYLNVMNTLMIQHQNINEHNQTHRVYSCNNVFFNNLLNTSLQNYYFSHQTSVKMGFLCLMEIIICPSAGICRPHSPPSSPPCHIVVDWFDQRLSSLLVCYVHRNSKPFGNNLVS